MTDSGREHSCEHVLPWSLCATCWYTVTTAVLSTLRNKPKTETSTGHGTVLLCDISFSLQHVWSSSWDRGRGRSTCSLPSILQHDVDTLIVVLRLNVSTMGLSSFLGSASQYCTREPRRPQTDECLELNNKAEILAPFQKRPYMYSGVGGEWGHFN